ncbi:hypothetical protein [Klebsiella pneumoniae]|uniref:hypothetical protein n=1 Tax=Klebsiella pneumoniae TaxID=573 RepID=UPI003896C4BE
MFPLRKNNPKRTKQQKLSKYNLYKAALSKDFFAVAAIVELTMFIMAQENVFT